MLLSGCASRGKPSLCFSLLTRFWYPLDRAPHTDFHSFPVDLRRRRGAFCSPAVHAASRRRSNGPSGHTVAGASSNAEPATAGSGPHCAARSTAVTPHLGVVVLDPAHGGADQGARGSWGIAESDVVLSFARLVRISLEAQGLRVILTRQANEDPSFDDRSRLANAQHGVIFITLHVSSTGQPGTVRVYSLPQPGAASVPLARRACQLGPRPIRLSRFEPQAGGADPDSDGAELSRLS